MVLRKLENVIIANAKDQIHVFLEATPFLGLTLLRSCLAISKILFLRNFSQTLIFYSKYVFSAQCKNTFYWNRFSFSFETYL